MKNQHDIARELASRRARELQAAGIRQRPKSWDGRKSPKQSRQGWRQRGES
jgi:hypothetical protein